MGRSFANLILAFGIAVASFASAYSWAEEEAPAVAVAGKFAPAIRSAEGSISSLDLGAQLPVLKLKSASGEERALFISKKSTTVWRDGAALSLHELKPLDKVRVRSMTKGGKEVAKTIEILTGS